MASLAIPLDALEGSGLTIRSITIAGSALASDAIPIHMQVSRGLQSPLTLVGVASDCSATPAISVSGVLVAPDCKNRKNVPIFSSNGASLAPIVPSEFGLEEAVRTAAIGRCAPGDESNDVLFLSDSHTLLAVDLAKRSVLWRTRTYLGNDLDMGLVLLPRAGVAVVTDYATGCLHVHSLKDGARLHTSAPLGAKPSHATGDPLSETISISSNGIKTFTWDGSTLTQREDPPDAGRSLRGSFMPMTVMMTSRQRGNGYGKPDLAMSDSTDHGLLLACAYKEPTIYMFSIPSHKLIRTHSFSGMEIVSLCADPLGNALAIGDAVSSNIHVIAWPPIGLALSAEIDCVASTT